MNKTAVFQRLIWKDIKSVQSLVMAICGAIVLLNLIVFVITAVMSPGMRGLDGPAIVMWVVLPMLVALGAPPMLIGNEEENGTLRWLRVLPIHWRDIAISKFIVGLGALLVSVAIASIVFLLVGLGSGPDFWSSIRANGSPWGALGFVAFGSFLLASGFISAYLFRSAVGGVLFTLPLVVIGAVLFAWQCHFVDAVLLQPFFDGKRSADRRWWAAVFTPIVVGLFFGSLLLAIKFAFARRRLLSPEGVTIQSIADSALETNTVHALSVSMFDRPSPVRAMLWQHGRQSMWFVALIGSFIGLSLFPDFISLFSSLFGVSSRNNSGEVLPIMDVLLAMTLPLGGCWLGAMAFFGDSIRRRCAYFADRGVSPTLVWWTRLLKPACIMSAVFALAVLIQTTSDWQSDRKAIEFRWLMTILLPVGFAFGQLVAMWSTKPILSLFAGPVYMYLCMMAILIFVILYPAYHLWLLVLFATLLFATWRLTPDWLDGRTARWFTARVIGYTAIALLLPCLIIVSIRLASMPSPMQQWRGEMRAMATNAEEAEVSESRISFLAKAKVPPTFSISSSATPGSSVSAFRDVRYEGSDWTSRLKNELDAETIVGSEVAFTDLVSALKITSDRFRWADNPPRSIEDAELVIAVLLKWARLAREHANEPVNGLDRLQWIGEPAEALAVDAMAAWASSLDDRSAASMRMDSNEGESPEDSERATDDAAVLSRLLDQVPSEDLRRESRRLALVSAWIDFDHQRESSSTALLTSHPLETLGSKPVAPHSGFFIVERVMAQRMVDAAVAESLRQVTSGLPNIGGREYEDRMELWRRATFPTDTLGERRSQKPMEFTSNWASDTELKVARIRQKLRQVENRRVLAK